MIVMPHKKRKIFWMIVLLSVVYLAGLAGYILWDNTRVVTTSYRVYSSNLPRAFDHYKIALITDFHNSPNVDKVVENVEQIEPNVIFMVGDMINMHSDNYNNFVSLMEKLVKIAPTYYTFGNHEVWNGHQAELTKLATSKGVTVLNNTAITLQESQNSINVLALKDPGKDDWQLNKEYLEDNFKGLYNKRVIKDGFSILLFHRANYFSQAAASPYDLMLAGHLHNGQVNLPVIQKHILRDKTNSDHYTKGEYFEGESTLVVSGGLEENLKSPRVFNTPEVVSIQLKSIQQ